MLQTTEAGNWGDFLTTTPKFYFPGDASSQKHIYLFTAIAALLDEAELPAGREAEQIIQEIRDATPWDAPDMPEDLPKSIPQKIEDLSKRFLYSSQDAADHLSLLLGLKAHWVPLVDSDEVRMNYGLVPKALKYEYGVRRYKAVRASIKRNNWKLTNVKKTLQLAALWVRARHVLKHEKLGFKEYINLKKPGDFYFGDDLDSETDRDLATFSEYQEYLRYLRPFDKYFGVIRGRQRYK